MLRVMKNNWNRLMKEKSYLIISVVLTIFSVSLAIILTSKMEVKPNLAIVSTEHAEEFKDRESQWSSYFTVSYVEKEPPMSELVKGRYDAVIIMGQDGNDTIKTIKSEEYKNTLQGLLTNPESITNYNKEARKIGTNIIGFMMMFILMQGVLYTRLFAEDKEKHMIERVAMSPIPFRKYLLGHGIFVWLIIIIPTYAVVAAAKFIGMEVGFSMYQYAMLLSLFTFFTVSFALFINSFFCSADTANMLGSSIIILTTVLAGGFYSITKKDTLFNQLLHTLPQKDFLNFTDALEKGTLTNQICMQLGYVILVSLIMLVIAIIKTNRDYVYKK